MSIALDDFDFFAQLFGFGGVGVTGDGADLVNLRELWVGEGEVDYRATLLACSPEYGEDFGHHEGRVSREKT